MLIEELVGVDPTLLSRSAVSRFKGQLATGDSRRYLRGDARDQSPMSIIVVVIAPPLIVASIRLIVVLIADTVLWLV
jgi:hypothetical protein